MRERNLIVALGDQLSARLPALRRAERGRDLVWMAEVAGESEYVWTAKQRVVMFLAAMRHFRDELRAEGWEVRYREIGDEPSAGTLGAALRETLGRERFGRVVATWPGEHRLLAELRAAVADSGHELELLEDDSFYCSAERFERHLAGRKQPRMEYFYREMRREHGVLMEGEEPCGGEWNYDASNRKPFGRAGPELLAARLRFAPDALTKSVIREVDTRFGGHPGSAGNFDWPVTREQALAALEHFVESELERFGQYQDAMWTGEPYLHHSLLAPALNLRLLDAREVVAAAEAAYRAGAAGLESVEGFVRQILGWREYVRGIYWSYMPEYLERNGLGAAEPLPGFYWTGETEMRCVGSVVRQTLRFGYAHHIQRLMVTGLYALLLGVRPQETHRWYLAVYVDAVEWVELPNTLGMSQYADGGVMGSKPYIASGKYIQKMSNYCEGCRFDPGQRTGPRACPFTTLYWDFLMRHEALLRSNPRMGMQLRNLNGIGAAERESIRDAAARLRADNREVKEGGTL